MKSLVNIFFCRGPLQYSSLENIATMSTFPYVSCKNQNNFSLL